MPAVTDLMNEPNLLFIYYLIVNVHVRVMTNFTLHFLSIGQEKRDFLF